MSEIFEGIGRIEYEGKDSKNPLAYKHFDPNKTILGKPMKEHLRFAVAFWHTFNGRGVDMFGEGSVTRPWDKFKDPMDKSKAKVDALFEFMQKTGIEYFCFHDTDITPAGDTLRETNSNLDIIVDYIKEHMKKTGKKLLWGTANLFNNKRYVHGAATSCNAEIFARAAGQVKKALEITNELGGKNYVLWGGREGYESLLNTNMELELDNLARFMRMAVNYARTLGFTGQFLIEPKPKEPTKHQYDFDSAHVYAFLQKFGLIDDFKLNIEANHATLAEHTFQHELRYARINNILGSIDANQGDLFLGWDTDHFPTDIYATTHAMHEILKNNGLGSGGINFDAKLRRSSIDTEDIFIGHIAGMDAFAAGLKAAAILIEEGTLDKFIEDRYSSYGEEIGKKIVNEETSFEELEKYILDKRDIKNSSGRIEYLETIITRALLKI
ncbi:MAG: xylose isomerase [Petrotogales bacterium]